MFYDFIILVATCSSIADIAFVVDSSGSLRYEFDKEKEFVQLLTATFDIRPEASRVGVVTFSYNAEVSIKYTDYNVKDKLIKAIRNLPLFGYTTRIDKGLQLAKEQLISKSVRERPNVPKFLILLTDGTQTQDKDAFDPVKIAEELRSMGVELFVIGIGSAINSTELNEIAGDKMNVYVATNFEELRSQGFVQKMAERTCRGNLLFHGQLSLRRQSYVLLLCLRFVGNLFQ